MPQTSTHMFDCSVAIDGHTRRFVIEQTTPLGWEVREEEDSRVVRSVRYTDWHRVERARTMIGLRVSDLTRNGWMEQ